MRIFIVHTVTTYPYDPSDKEYFAIEGAYSTRKLADAAAEKLNKTDYGTAHAEVAVLNLDDLDEHEQVMQDMAAGITQEIP